MPLFRRLLPAFWALFTIAIVGGVVWYGLNRVQQSPANAAGEAAVEVPTQPAYLKPGHDYYLLVKLVEFAPRKPNGSYWDRGTNTTPDPKAYLFWRGQEIYKFPTREDQFIATWDLFRVDLKELAMSAGKVDIASAINAPLVRVEPGETVRIDVYDSDVMGDDLAMTTPVRLDRLVDGDNDIPPPEGAGVRRLVVQAVDRQSSLSDLIAIASKR